MGVRIQNEFEGRFAALCGPTIFGFCRTRQQTKTNDEKLVEEVENET